MSTKPEITVTATDADKLFRLIESLPQGAYDVAHELENELVRANTVAASEVPANVVTMNSTVLFSTNSSGQAIEMTLVYPKDLDQSGSKISILAPVGCALLGLKEGDAITWPKPGGGNLEISIEKLLYQPENAGRQKN